MLVRGTQLEAGAARAEMPFPIEPDGAGQDFESLIRLLTERRENIAERLLKHGVLLFRGWEVAHLDQFAGFVRAFATGGELLDYAGGASPRSALEEGGRGVYSSTDYPPHIALSLHNELSYADTCPSHVYFFCVTAPIDRGETTLADSRRILARIDPAVVDRFRRKGVRYIRNLGAQKGWGYSWQEALETDERETAEAHCRRIGADFEWQADGSLRMSQARPATAVHPATGEEVWFNQADGFHPSALDPESYAEALLHAGSEERFRLNVSYGDGSPIERDTLEHIRAVLREETIPHRWRKGDILVIDNLLAAHGRAPFSGPRKIAVAMT